MLAYRKANDVKQGGGTVVNSPQQVRSDESTNLLPLVDAVREATSMRPALSTVLRWSQKPNQHGVRLQTWKVGGRRLTSVEAVRAYIDATTQAADTGQLPTATNRQRNDAHQKAMAELERQGI
ncbi:hypothetical protein Pla52o_39350 [Novipirellula galeiformis]|uniref:Uncharacterized protein n=2 Tax=Novipirellula galeiformis TaxID=2528004 RepID=A0A5C6CBY3_9BACT|nr:hypothetical protein Pla52o_39350 [Novipirellula galeiformis]